MSSAGFSNSKDTMHGGFPDICNNNSNNNKQATENPGLHTQKPIQLNRVTSLSEDTVPITTTSPPLAPQTSQQPQMYGFNRQQSDAYYVTESINISPKNTNTAQKQKQTKQNDICNLELQCHSSSHHSPPAVMCYFFVCFLSLRYLLIFAINLAFSNKNKKIKKKQKQKQKIFKKLKKKF